MATILFLPLPEKGHLIASFKIARRLKARGHRVYYLGLIDFEEYILSQGLEFVPLFELLFRKGFISERPLGVPIFEALGAVLQTAGMSHDKTGHDLLNEEIDLILARVQPHLLIIDAYLAVLIPLIIERLAYPCLMLNPTVYFPLHENSPEYRNLAFARVLELTTLTLCPEEFDFPELENKRAHHHYVEASVDLSRKDVEFPWGRIDDEKRLVYCSLGTQSHWSFEPQENEVNQRVRQRFLQHVIAAIEGLQDWQLILSLGGHLRPEDFQTDSSSTILVNNAPQLDILKRTSVMITHGGLNTIKECILLGVPMIVFPLQGDQLGNAARVAYHHLGFCGQIESATIPQIQEFINEIDRTPEIRSNVARMSRIFQRREEAGQAVELIESAIVQSGLRR